MNTLTHDELKELAGRRATPSVTILLPVDPVAERWRNGPIQLQNLLEQARQQLLALGARNGEANTILEPAARLIDDTMRWKEPGLGLVIFLAQGFQRVLRVPTTLPETLVVADRFQVRPLLKLLQDDGTFYVLAVSEKQNRLLRCTHHTVEQVPLPGAPLDLDEATRFIEEGTRDRHAFANSRTANTGIGGPNRGPTLDGQGFGHEDRKKNEMMDYLRPLSEAVAKALQGQGDPLLFAGVDVNLPLYASANSYPHFVEGEGVFGNPDLRSDDEIRDLAWPMVDHILQQRLEQDLDRLRNSLDSGRVTTSLEQVLSAAASGRIDTLFVSLDNQLFGTFDPDKLEMHVHESREPGDGDLLNEAAVLGLFTGANVYVLPPEELPAGEGEVNALLRW